VLASLKQMTQTEKLAVAMGSVTVPDDVYTINVQ
jgi:hypothetical protein